jgi:hypothetical protein
MEIKKILSGRYSSTLAGDACGVKPKSVTNYTPRYIKPDVESRGSGTGHEFTGYTIIRMALFFDLCKTGFKFSHAARILWPEDKPNEEIIKQAIEEAAERYVKAISSKSLLGQSYDPVYLELYPGEHGYQGNFGFVIASQETAKKNYQWDKPISIVVSVSHAVRTVVEHLMDKKEG